MESWRYWDDFLKVMSRNHQLTDAETESFLLQFARENIGKSLEEISGQLPLMENQLQTHKKRMFEVYDKFSQSYTDLKSIQHKSKPLQKWLETQYSQWLPVQNYDSASLPGTTETPINWQEICRKMLPRRLSSNPLMQGEDGTFEPSRIYVSLALVQRRRADKFELRSCCPEMRSRLYEPQYYETKRFEHEAFLTQIIEQRQGKTKQKQIALIGEPGAGKTTLLQTIAEWVLDKNLGFPIWISLADLGRNGSLIDFQTYVDFWLTQAIPATELTPSVKQDFTAQIQQGKVWLLLDGVDEVAASGVDTLYEISQQLKGWIAASRIVLTCRLNVWQANFNALRDFETYRLLDFDYPQQVHQFIDNWFDPPQPPLAKGGQEISQSTLAKGRKEIPQPPLAKGGQEISQSTLAKGRKEIPQPPLAKGGQESPQPPLAKEGQEISQPPLAKGGQENREQLEIVPPLGKGGLGGDRAQRLKAELDSAERSRLRDLVQNPLRLALLCSIWGNEAGNLPQTKAGIYHQFVQQLYCWKESAFRISKKQQWELNRALGELALRDIDESNSRFRLRESFICEVLGDPDDENSLFYNALKFGWLNYVGIAAESASREKVYAFFHPSFEEYFAALAIDDWQFFLNHVPDNPIQGIYRIFEPQWKEVFLLWLGREDVDKEKKEEFIKALIEFEDRCGDRCLIPEWNGFGNYRAFFIAAAGVAEFGDSSIADEVVTQIVKWVFGYFNIEKQRWQTFLEPSAEGARQALLQTNSKIAVNKVIDVIETTEDRYIRRSAAEILAEIGFGNETAIASLLRLLETTEDVYIRRSAAEILPEIGLGNETAIASLLRLLETNENDYICISAAESLGKIEPGNETASATILRIIETTEKSNIRSIAVESLEKIALVNETAIATILRIIKITEDDYIRSIAVDSLGEIGCGNETAIATILRIIEITEDDNIRSIASDCLEKIGLGNETAIATLVRIIETTENEEIRSSAVYSLGEIGSGNETAIATIVRILENNENDDIRISAVECLGKIGFGNETAIATILRILETTENCDIRRSAAESLGKIGLGNETAIATILRIIETTENVCIRRSAAESLGKIGLGNETAIATLVRILETTENDDIRWSAANCLGKIDPGNKTTLATILRLLETTENEDIRRSAVDSLGEIGGGNETAIATLVRIIETTENFSIRKSAAESLGKIDPGNQTAIATLVRILETTENDHIRRSAADSLGKIDPGNQTAIATLVRIMETTQNDHIRWRAAESLGKIDPGNETAIATLVRIMETTENDHIRDFAADCLGKIGLGNQTAIATLLRIIETTENDYICISAADCLGKIGLGNQTAIATLLRIMETTEDNEIRRCAADILGKIGLGNETALPSLLRLLETTKDSYIRRKAAQSLEEIGLGNETAIATLVRILENTENYESRWKAADSLGEIVQKEQMRSLVSALRHCLSEQIYKTNFDLYENCYKLIWKCAQEMPYPEFYQAWHQMGEETNVRH